MSSVSAVSWAEKPEHLAEDQHGALVGRQELKRGDEGELDRLALLVAGIRRRVPPSMPSVSSGYGSIQTDSTSGSPTPPWGSAGGP